ncbi:hypothetical protein PILCRDRAFT_73114 [Piloderma croceum F 1598]|uniref:Protein kinase domain-containing protein n=1 Tax=Piloderma croceum (strain F 1598) TaxID=765440 RepID=A0A0C3FKQ2_PILCF|nr:hypothetical protein PILCRDRAFT_73114 [Piloderma croceum F 1598]
MKLHDFLVEHAKFPFPDPGEIRSAGSTDISTTEVGLVKVDWKAQHAVRDNTLVQKLCCALEKILGNAPLAAGAENYLLPSFSPQIQLDERGSRDPDWITNPSEAHSRSLLDKGFFVAVRKCLWEYNGYSFGTRKEHVAEGGGSKVDYVALVDGGFKALLLPSHGIKLKWVQGQTLVPKILTKAALYLGLRKMEWLFLTCHNYWIVCRLVRDDDHPYLVYSQEISINDSSKPFQAFLGAILSIVKGVPVESSAYNSDMQFDTIEEEDDGPSPEDNIDDDSGVNRGSSARGAATGSPMTRSHPSDGHGYKNTESELMVTSSSPKSPEHFQVWMHLYTMSNNTLVLPQCARNSKPRLWLTRFVASGSTGNAWQCRFDNSDDLFTAKIVEVLHRSDADSRQRLRNEFNVYLILDEVYQSGRLCDHIAPRCYGAFEGNTVDVLILDLCDGILNAWDELSASERYQVYKLVQDLHSVGITHEDLEPRNIVRAHGGFLLISFSESRRHICKESKCSELQTFQKLLWKRQPLQADHVNLG